MPGGHGTAPEGAASQADRLHVPVPPQAESPGGTADSDRTPCAETGAPADGDDTSPGKRKKAIWL